MIIPKISVAEFSTDASGQQKLIECLRRWSLFGVVAIGNTESWPVAPLEAVLQAVGGSVDVEIELAGLLSRTGSRATRYLDHAHQLGMPVPINCTGPDGLRHLLQLPLDVVCIATPQRMIWLGGLNEQRHFDALLNWAAQSSETNKLSPLPAPLAELEFERFQPLTASVGAFGD